MDTSAPAALEALASPAQSTSPEGPPPTFTQSPLRAYTPKDSTLPRTNPVRQRPTCTHRAKGAYISGHLLLSSHASPPATRATSRRFPGGRRLLAASERLQLTHNRPPACASLAPLRSIDGCAQNTSSRTPSATSRPQLTLPLNPQRFLACNNFPNPRRLSENMSLLSATRVRTTSHVGKRGRANAQGREADGESGRGRVVDRKRGSHQWICGRRERTVGLSNEEEGAGESRRRHSRTWVFAGNHLQR
jgi:hypothetical protein